MFETDKIDNMELNYNEALRRSAALCSKGECCQRDIKNKLVKWGLNSCDIEKITTYLCTEKYIDHKRYARSFVSDKFRFDKWGRVKIRYALKGKGIDDTDIDDAVRSVISDADYEEALRKVLAAKIKTKGGIIDAKIKASVYNFAVMRGYEPDLVFKFIRTEFEK